MQITVTGAAGYIGSHACLKLLEAGHVVHGIDNFSRGFARTVAALELAGGDRFHFTKVELCDQDSTNAALMLRPPELVMHFAALAVVPESVKSPEIYWHNNLNSTVSLLKAMEAVEAGKLVFSSTCTTYGEPRPESIPIGEECEQNPTHAYGQSKLACEQLIRGWAESKPPAGRDRGAVILRYFNVAGCDRLGRVGEDHEPETHLMPCCLRSAAGDRAELVIHGRDYPTPDGTCIRDYVHVEDLVDAHVEAMNVIPDRSILAMNVGTGTGTSVLEVLRACGEAAGRDIPHRFGPRREGDPSILVCDPAKIIRMTRWRPRQSSIRSIAQSAWRWIESRDQRIIPGR